MENIVNEPALKYNYVTAEEYLNGERQSDIKHELHQGTIVTMTGTSLQHNRIVANIIMKVGYHINGNGCEIFPSDLRLKTPGIDTFTYPDVMIICGEPEMNDDKMDTVKNPSVIFEVSSPSTEDYDRGNKFFYYMQITSLKEYIIINSQKMYVQAARKQADGSWLFEEKTLLDDYLRILTIDYNILLSDLYNNVKF